MRIAASGIAITLVVLSAAACDSVQPSTATTPNANATAPPASLTPGTAFTVTLAGDDAAPLPVSVVDAAAALTDVRSASDAERRFGESKLLAEADIGLARFEAGVIVLTWIGTACDTGFDVAVDAGRRSVVVGPRPREGCDLGRVSHAVVLTFRDDPDIASFTLELRRPILLGG